MTTTGDGIISALQVLAAMLEFDQSLDALKAGMKKYPQHMINVACKKKMDLEGVGGLTDAVLDTEKQLGGRGRVLLRPSGTEPVVRVMVEGEDLTFVTNLTQELAAIVSEELG